MDAPDQDPLALLTNYQDAIDACLRRQHVPAVDVPDLRQVVYQLAIQYLETHEVQAMSAFLQRIAERVAADYWKQRKIHERAAPRLAEEDLAASNPEHEYNEAEIQRHLDDILDTLEARDPRGRALLRARFGHNKKTKEIAAEFNLPTSTAHHLVTKAVSTLAEEFKKRGIRSRSVLPFIQESHTHDGPAEAGGTTDKPEAPVTFTAPIPPSTPPSERAWRVLSMLASAAAGALVVFLLMRSAQPVARLSPIFVTVAASGEPSTPGGLLEQDRAFVCPEVVQAPAPAPPSHGGAPPEADINAKNRHLARIIKAAEARGDCETANKLRQELTGAFAAAFATHSPCRPTP
ncbi:sigma-70 family RNA polymerase sigma factor [Polyangium sp. y55x31]|uniref:sigma-70 family RNA polymerase sigma factor n=1 Tax=Polyangium sp. y55x31 TaxID=3042688 RepID=UPI0024832998|nr:sigma-70 family RNA polymerase sigma factor [Polyangium sp. y55x31]MDI1484708.1 sigma-70 family RNA polymerase sigma factor [Polyangium sp. y55x31]